MTEADRVAVLEDLYRAETSSFVRYLVGVSRPCVVDDVDRRALAVLQDLWRESERRREGLIGALEGSGDPPRSGAWPLEFTHYNYLRPRSLLRPLRSRLAGELESIAAIEKRSRDLAGEEAARWAEDIRRGRERDLARLEKAEGEIPEETLEPGHGKGTSAARW